MRKLVKIQTPALDREDFKSFVPAPEVDIEGWDSAKWEFGATQDYNKMWFKNGGFQFTRVERIGTELVVRALEWERTYQQ